MDGSAEEPSMVEKEYIKAKKATWNHQKFKTIKEFKYIGLKNEKRNPKMPGKNEEKKEACFRAGQTIMKKKNFRKMKVGFYFIEKQMDTKWKYAPAILSFSFFVSKPIFDEVF